MLSSEWTFVYDTANEISGRYYADTVTSESKPTHHSGGSVLISRSVLQSDHTVC